MEFKRDKKNRGNIVCQDETHIYVISQVTKYVLTIINRKTGVQHPQMVRETVEEAKSSAEIARKYIIDKLTD